jgi:hypothetical protein
MGVLICCGLMHINTDELSVWSILGHLLSFQLKIVLVRRNKKYLPCGYSILFYIIFNLPSLNLLQALDTFNTAVVSPIYYTMFTSLTILASVINLLHACTPNLDLCLNHWLSLLHSCPAREWLISALVLAGFVAIVFRPQYIYGCHFFSGCRTFIWVRATPTSREVVFSFLFARVTPWQRVFPFSRTFPFCILFSRTKLHGSTAWEPIFFTRVFEYSQSVRISFGVIGWRG